MKTDEGLEGIGSGDTMTGFAGHEHLFVGHDPLDIERHYRILDNIQFHYGRCWPLDLALWDLAGKIAGAAVWRLLGGRSDRVPAYASSATLRDAGAMAEAAERYLARGFRGLKLRFHRGDWRDDIRALEAVRERDRRQARADGRLQSGLAHEPRRRGAVDAEGRASRRARAGAPRRLLDGGAAASRRPQGDARAAREVDIRIAGGEMNRELYEFRDLIEERCLDVLQPDVALTGGITGLRRVARWRPRRGLIFTPHTWSNGLSYVANAHFTCGAGQRAVPGVSLRSAGMVARTPRLHDDGDERRHEGRDGGAVGEAGVWRGAG